MTDNLNSYDLCVLEVKKCSRNWNFGHIYRRKSILFLGIAAMAHIFTGHCSLQNTCLNLERLSMTVGGWLKGLIPIGLFFFSFKISGSKSSYQNF